MGFISNNNEYALSHWKTTHTVVNAKSMTDEELTTFLANRHNEIMGLGPERLRLKTSTLSESSEVPPPGTYIYDRSNYDKPCRLTKIETKTEENYLNISALDALKADIDTFLSSKDLYAELKFSYRRAYLLYGAPGNGKTALIRQFTNAFKDTALILWCRDTISATMLQELNTLPMMKIVVYEELISNGSSSDLDMGEFLDMMDGGTSLKNCITIATTNYPHRLQANLANRPSRFDVVAEVKNPTKDQAYLILSQFLGRTVTAEEIPLREMSFAHLKEMVLLHKMFNIPLIKAQEKLIQLSTQFENGFEEKKQFGF